MSNTHSAACANARRAMQPPAACSACCNVPCFAPTLTFIWCARFLRQYGPDPAVYTRGVWTDINLCEDTPPALLPARPIRIDTNNPGAAMGQCNCSTANYTVTSIVRLLPQSDNSTALAAGSAVVMQPCPQNATTCNSTVANNGTVVANATTAGGNSTNSTFACNGTIVANSTLACNSTVDANPSSSTSPAAEASPSPSPEVQPSPPAPASPSPLLLPPLAGPSPSPPPSDSPPPTSPAALPQPGPPSATSLPVQLPPGKAVHIQGGNLTLQGSATVKPTGAIVTGAGGGSGPTSGTGSSGGGGGGSSGSGSGGTQLAAPRPQRTALFDGRLRFTTLGVEVGMLKQCLLALCVHAAHLFCKQVSHPTAAYLA